MSGAGSVAVVTGASSGIGRACAVRLARAGHRVFAVGRDTGALAALASQQPGVVPHEQDLGTDEAAAAAVAAAAGLGPPLVGVHAAGLGGYLDRPISEADPDAWRRTLAVNLDTAFFLVRHLLPHMREAGWGRFVAVGSTAGAVATPGQPAYSASKAGLLGLVRSAGYDLGAVGATCNAVVPGWVRGTAMAEADAAREAGERGVTVDQVWAERAAGYPGGRVLDPDEVAAVVAFLASDDASGVNGEAVTVSRGSPW